MALARRRVTGQDAEAGAGGARIAAVTHADAGSAITIVPLDGTPALEVYAHLDDVPHLRERDTVCYLPSDQGPVVIGRLRRTGEAPAARLHEQGGHLEIGAQQSITLRTGASRVELSADGRLRLDGREIEQIAQGRFSLVGAVLELN